MSANESSAAISTVSLNKVSTTDLADVPQADVDYATPAPKSMEKKSDFDDSLGDTLSIASGHGTVKFNRNTVYHDAMSMTEDEEIAEGVLEGDSHVRGSNMFSIVTNLTNAIIGSGM